MTAFRSILWREYAAFFRVPLGWIVAALLLFLSGVIFYRSGIVPGQPASMREFFAGWWRVLVIISPAISMRLFADEFRNGTIEPLLSSPAAEVAAVAGKYFAAVAFLATCLLPTLIYWFILASLARPDPGPVIAGYLGILLLGMFQLAVGTLFSSLTSSQTLAFLSTLFALVLLEIGASAAAAALPRPWDAAVLSLSTDRRIADFARGIISTEHVAFFLIASAWLCGVSAVTLRARRWR